jgi:NADH:ubiquinone oxidoreductase subunit 3 (subunit A)
VTNYPLPRTNQQLQINNTISGFFASFIFSLALAFKFASIMAFIVKEREDRSKHQQIVSGMKLSAYWAANFIYDYILYLILAVVTVGLCSALSIGAFTSGSAYTGLWLLFILYGLAYIPFTYMLAFAFKDYGNAQAGYYFLTFIIGGMLPILTLLLRILGAGSNPIGKGLAWFLRIYPAFSFGEGLINIGSVTAFGTI